MSQRDDSKPVGSAKLTGKEGQGANVPKEARTLLGLARGDVLLVYVVGNRMIFTLAPRLEAE